MPNQWLSEISKHWAIVYNWYKVIYEIICLNRNKENYTGRPI